MDWAVDLEGVAVEGEEAIFSTAGAEPTNPEDKRTTMEGEITILSGLLTGISVLLQVN